MFDLQEDVVDPDTGYTQREWTAITRKAALGISTPVVTVDVPEPTAAILEPLAKESLAKESPTEAQVLESQIN